MSIATDDKLPSSERQQTDESLRFEREKVDQSLGQELAALDEAADAVIITARQRADAVLAAARGKLDRNSSSPAPASQASVAKERVLEDQVLREERADADETLRAERAEHAAVISTRREETDKDLLSERVRSDSAVAARDDFLGIVSHDLRDLLNTMLLFAKLIAEGVLRDNHVEQVLQHAQRIQRAGGRMNRLIGDLVDVASIEAGVLAVTAEISDPTHVVTEAVNALHDRALANGVSLVAETVPSLAAFDPARILQVLINLLNNAIKFTPRNGKVTLRAEPVGAEIQFAISDTGMGIPTDKLATIFERFAQIEENDRRGVGLGLYISKCIVQGHGGRIWAESKLGEGSTIRFTLPMAASA